MKYNVDGASHLPILIKVLELSSGPVLELGMGPFSTPILHWLCLDMKRSLVSYENNLNYFKVNKTFESDFHQVNFIENWDEMNIDDVRWGVVFVDHSPGNRRNVDIKRLANSANYVIIHDSEECYDSEYHYSEIYPLFKYRYDYKRQKPYTSVLSNFKDLSFLSK